MIQTFILIAALASFGIGWVVIQSRSKALVNRAFAVFVFLTSGWSLVNWISGFVVNSLTLRLTFVFGALVPTSAIYWLLVFTAGQVRGKKRMLLNVFILASLVLAALSLFTPLIARGNANALVLGKLFPLYAVILLAGVLTPIILCARYYTRAGGLQRLQTRYILYGVSLFGLTAFIVSFLLPLVGVTSVGRLDSVSSLFFVVFSAYAIIRHRLMDTRVIIRRSFIYVGLGIFTVAGYYGALWLDNHVFGGSYSIGGYLSALLITPLFLFAFSWLRQWFDRIANRYFFTSLYNYQTTLEDLARQLTSVIDLHKVVDLIVGSIMKTMGLDRAGVLLLSSEKNSKRYDVAKVVGFNEQNGISLVRNNFLVQWLEQNRKLVVWEELGSLIDETVGDNERSQLMRLKTNMTKIEASTCLPLFSKDQLIGIIVLGNKVTKEAYTSEDLRLLQSITNQAAVAIQNARLYDQVQDLNHNLEQKVSEQTKDITEKNEHLRELLKMKSEFLTIASHQLRTPLTAVRGLLAMQAEGDFSKLPAEEVKTNQQHMLDSANRLSGIVNDLLKAMELEGGSLHFDFQEVQLEEMIDSVCSDLKPNYDRKELYLKFDHPNPPMPKIEVEPKMLHEVLMNIVDNAEKYTNTGGTTIALSTKNDMVTVTVKDTGVGIPKTDRPKLFKKFSRGEKSTYQHTDGSGLGLFIAKNVIDEHHGTIDISSDGEGKGTSVTIILPIHQPNHSLK